MDKLFLISKFSKNHCSPFFKINLRKKNFFLHRSSSHFSTHNSNDWYGQDDNNKNCFNKSRREYLISIGLISTPFYASTIYLLGNSIFLSDISFLANTSRFAVKALIMNQCIWSGINMGVIVKEMEIKNNIGDRDNFRLFINYLTPCMSFFVGYFFLLPHEITKINLVISFLAFSGINFFQFWIDKKLLVSSIAPVWLLQTKSNIMILNMFFIFLLFVFLAWKIDIYNYKKSKLNIDELKIIFENTDEEFSRQVEINENLINLDEISRLVEELKK